MLSCFLGATSGFPLLDLLTANSREHQPRSIHPDQSKSALSTTGDAVDIQRGEDSSPSAPPVDDPFPPKRGRTLSAFMNAKATSSSGNMLQDGLERRSREETFFPDRAPRPSQMLNPEATWRVITNVIPSDLMDTLVRCYVSRMILFDFILSY
jgi:hypothetical protein